jgi:hypothetical protein
VGRHREDDLASRLKEEWLKGLPNLGDTKTPRRRFPSQGIIGALVPILATGGVFIYAILSIAYELFYSPLGVDPAEVGLDYTGILARSVGFTLVITGILINIIVIVIVLPSASGPIRNLIKRTPNRTSTRESFYVRIARPDWPRRLISIYLLYIVAARFGGRDLFNVSRRAF